METGATVQVLWGGVAAIPLIMGLVQALKLAGLPSGWAPLASLIVGLGGSIWFGQASGEVMIQASVAQGLYVGLAASGFYSALDTGRRVINGARNGPTDDTE